MAGMNSLQDLYIEQLQDLYDAEHQLIKALPQMMEAASSPDLKQAFQMHLDQTKEQAARLEQVFEHAGSSPKRKACKAMQGLIAESQELLKEKADPAVMDAGLIASAQRVEHYEMAGYGTVRTWAKQLGHNDAAKLLQQTLDEEEQTDEKLNKLAESKINKQAM